MRIAFYAPMKPPDHPTPSGDQRMGNLLMQALRGGGHEVELVSRLRVYDGVGDPAVQKAIAEASQAEARRLIQKWMQAPTGRPEAWFTYHVYHKAPDLIGPQVARYFRIPYLIAEPSVAPKRANGPWAFGYNATLKALHAADRVLCLTRLDTACVAAAVDEPEKVLYLPPFLDTRPFIAAYQRRVDHRTQLVKNWGLDPNALWVLVVGMMRPGDKELSYQRLGEALDQVPGEDWQLVVVGDGKARPSVERALANLRRRPTYLGVLPGDKLPSIYAACDLYVWPAANEAYGLALLEAAAGGLPSVAGRVRGVPDVVMDGSTGILVPELDMKAFAATVRELLDDGPRRAEMAITALTFADEDRSLVRAAERLNAALEQCYDPPEPGT